MTLPTTPVKPQLSKSKALDRDRKEGLKELLQALASDEKSTTTIAKTLIEEFFK